MKGNYLTLTEDQVKIFNDRFEYKLCGDGVLVTTKNFNRSVFHKASEGFQAIAKIDQRKITLRITPRAIEIWRTKGIEKGHTLIDVQNIINNVLVSSQQVSDEDILKKL